MAKKQDREKQSPFHVDNGKTAPENYNELQRRILAEAAAVETALKEHRARTNQGWGAVGSLQYALKQLIELNDFLYGG